MHTKNIRKKRVRKCEKSYKYAEIRKYTELQKYKKLLTYTNKITDKNNMTAAMNDLHRTEIKD